MRIVDPSEGTRDSMERVSVLKRRNSVIGTKVMKFFIAAFPFRPFRRAHYYSSRRPGDPIVRQRLISGKDFEMRVSVSPEVLKARISGEEVLLNLEDKSHYRLNETAAKVWAGLERGDAREVILDSVLESYEIDRESAAREIDK